VESTGGAVSAATADGGGAVVRIELEAVELDASAHASGAAGVSDNAENDDKAPVTSARDDPILMEL
jgi:hypothetical protein